MLHLALVTVVVDDYDRAIDHFVSALGFELVEDTPQGAGKRWVVVRPPGGHGTALLLARAAGTEQEGSIGRQTGGRVAFFLHTDDMDQERGRMEAAGVRFVEATRAEPYGLVAVWEDLYGNRWDLIEPRPAGGPVVAATRLDLAGLDGALAGEAVTLSAGPRTDWFCDPRTGTTTRNAPLAVAATGTMPVTVSCHVAPTLDATFDAAALFVHYDDEHWVKLALERSPAGDPTVVSVRTAQGSDDCNHWTLARPECWLRVALDDRSVALHAGEDGSHWDLVRYCPAPLDTPPSVSLLVQSPTGQGTTATFSGLRVEPQALQELRDGS